MPGLGIIVTFAFSWVPLVSPITAMFLVSTFRKRVYSLLTLTFYGLKDKKKTAVLISTSDSVLEFTTLKHNHTNNICI